MSLRASPWAKLHQFFLGRVVDKIIVRRRVIHGARLSLGERLRETLRIRNLLRLRRETRERVVVAKGLMVHQVLSCATFLEVS